MKVLLIGGNDILQRAIAAALIERSHDVRTAVGDKDRLTAWPAHAEPQTHDSGTAIRAAAAACDAIVVIDPSVAPGAQATDGEGLDAVPSVDTPSSGRVIHVVAGHAAPPDRQGSAGHLTLRTSPVYGVGDDFVTIFLIMMRSLPVVPVLSDTHALRPLWHEDLARAIAAAVTLDSEQPGQTVDIAGPDRVTQDELYERLALLIDRHPLRVPIPDFIAAYGTRLAEGLRMSTPFEASHLAFVRAGLGADDLQANMLHAVFGVMPTTLDEGLRRLVERLPELSPADGVGRVEIKRFSTLIAGGRFASDALLRAFRAQFRELMPVEIGVEPAARALTLDEGAVVTMALPGRGHVQVRVEEATGDCVVLSTLRGHALAGFVRFRTRPVGDAVEFEVMTCDAAANAMDWLALTLGGARIQDANWARLAENVGAMAGGSAAPVQTHARKLDAEETTAVDRWIRAVVERHKASSEPVSGSLPKV